MAILRILVGISVPAICVFGLWYVYNYGNPAKCVFYELTGLFCPGCGSGRALYALLHFDIAAAAGYNCLFIPLALPAGAAAVYGYLRFVFPRLELKPISIPGWAAAACMVLIFAFWIARNIPAFSFLAP